MGVGNSRTWSTMLDELVDSPAPVNKHSPPHGGLTTDPRSPSNMIDRTPISLDESLSEGNFFDPRSPTMEFNRTPITGLDSTDVVSDLLDVPVFDSVLMSHVDVMRRTQLSFESSLDDSGTTSLGTTPDRPISADESKSSSSSGSKPAEKPRKNITALRKKQRAFASHKLKENLVDMNRSYSDTEIELSSSTPQKLLSEGKKNYRRPNRLPRSFTRFASSMPRSPLVDLNYIDNSPRGNNTTTTTTTTRTSTDNKKSTSAGRKVIEKLQRASLTSSSSGQYNSLSDKENEF